MNEERKINIGSYGSFKELFLSYPIGIAATLTIGLVTATGFSLGMYELGKGIGTLFQNNPIYQHQVIGDLTPDVYIERDGVRYFSQIDGKNIEDCLSQNL